MNRKDDNMMVNVLEKLINKNVSFSDLSFEERKWVIDTLRYKKESKCQNET